MRTGVLMSAAFIALAGCTSTMAAVGVPAGSTSSSTGERVEREPTVDREAERGNGRATRARGPRKLNGVPPGHYPKPGECRLWHSGRPPGQQPKPASCRSLMGKVPAGAFILYGGNAYDADYDWVGEASRSRESVPQIIVDIVRSIRK